MTMLPQLVKEPIYQQLNQVLRSLLGSEEFPAGRRFLTEREVCGRFHVSRATANKALSNLVAEGLLEFRKGVGTFVRGGTIDYDMRSLVSFTTKALAAGKNPSTRVLAFGVRRGEDLEPEIAAALGAMPDERVYYLERLRNADAIPVILERRYVPALHCPGLNVQQLSGSIYELWTEYYALEVSGADQVIRAVSIGKHDAALLQVRAGAAGLLVSSVGYLRNGRPLWFERTLYRGDSYEFHNRLGGIQPARSAFGKLLDPKPAAGDSAVRISYKENS